MRVVLAVLLCGAPLVLAQETGQPASAEELNKKLNDPTQGVKSFVFQDIPVINYYGRSGSSNQIMFQPVVPFTMYKHDNILRLTLPYNSGGVGGRGLAPIQIFNLTIFKVGRGQFAIGPLLNFNPNWKELPEGDRIQAGPALGYVTPRGKWTLGMLQQNLFSVNVQLSAFQPIIAYAFPKGWSLSTGQAQWAFVWSEGGGLTGIPLGVSVGKLVTLPGKQMVKFGVNPEYNAKARNGSPHWTVRFSANFLVR